MMRFGIALAAAFGVLFVANPASADEPATAPPPTPVAVAGPTMTETVTMSTVPARRGLFPRLRSRRNMSTSTMTVMPASGTSVAPMPMPAASTTPMTPVVPASGTIAVEGGPAVTTSGYVTMSETSVRPMRRGIFSRLRMRR